jgi:F0F1-type ATP synthase membrane subunit b/b'
VELNATILIQAAIVLALMAFLSPVLFGPALKVFDEREKRIHGAADEAKRQLGTAGEKAALVEQKLQAAQVDARQVLAALREKALAGERELLDKARNDANVRIEKARGELNSATDSARSSLTTDANAIADDIVKKVLGRAA